MQSNTSPGKNKSPVKKPERLQLNPDPSSESVKEAANQLSLQLRSLNAKGLILIG